MVDSENGGNNFSSQNCPGMIIILENISCVFSKIKISNYVVT